MARNPLHGKYHALRRDVFGDDEDGYRQFLQDNFGKSSSTRLSKSEICEAVDLLQEMLPGSAPRRKQKYGGAGIRGTKRHLTPGQAERIALLEAMLGWDAHPGRLIGFIERQLGKPKAVEWLMNHEAVKVILGLQMVYVKGDANQFKMINQLQNQELRELCAS